MTDWQPEKLRDFFFHYDFANPDHKRGIDLLQKHAALLMHDNADWVKAFRGEDGTSEDYLSKAAKIIAVFEGFRSTPYKCPAGIWTIGFGSTYYPNGSLVTPTDTAITREQALGYLGNVLTKGVAPALSRTVPTWGIMNANQKAAIVSFAYNLGSNFYGTEGFATITKALSSRDNFKNVPQALLLYVNPGSSFEAGLKRRRQAEGELWNGRGQFAG